MAVAGKVAITLSTENGGAWSADVTYDRLVAVKHNNNLYISRKTVANVEPPNDEFWFLALEGFGGDDVQTLIDRMNELSDLIQAIINGTTQVGNAKTLDGHGAEYFAKASQFEFVSMPTGTDLNNCTEQGFYYFDGYAYNYTNTPNINAHNGIMRVYRRSENRIEQIYYSINDEKTYTRAIVGAVTTNWQTLATADDLANYLPKTGGNLGNGSSGTPLRVVGRSDGTYIIFNDNTGDKAYLGISSLGKLVMLESDLTTREILHTGNKPTGTYTGNGSATARTINVGGIGNAVLVWSGGLSTMAIVTPTGYIGKEGTSLKAGHDTYLDGNGNIIMETTDNLFNANGRGYGLQML